MTIDIQAMQSDLRAARFDGWLFYDFRGRDPIAHRILHLPPGMRTRMILLSPRPKGINRSSARKA